jgi:tyrosyl-tRNA synthetase
MYRYYELLTDLSLAEIGQLKERVLHSALHPKQVKMDLARRIITDFHSAADGERAAREWQRVVSAGEVPADIRTVRLDGSVLRLDKVLAKVGLAGSVTEATRKIKAGAVEIDGQKVTALIQLQSPGEYVVRLGRNWRRVIA